MFCFLGAAPALFAANEGSIAGVVVGPGGDPAAKARVTLVRRLSGDSREVIADAAGNYKADGLLPGDYTLTATSPLDDSSAEQSVEIRDGKTVQLRVFLGSSPVADSDLPIEGRNYLDLVRDKSEITPGEQGGNIEGFGPYGLRGNASLNSFGQRAQNNNFLLDGMDNNGAWVRGLVVPAALEAAGGVTTLAGYIPAEYGHAAGAVVSVASLAGSDQLHGSAFEYGQTSAVNARNFFDGPKPSTAGNQFGAAIGGPIRPGKWFFFFDAEAERQRLGQTVTSTVPTKTQKGGLFPASTAIFDPLTLHAVAPDIYQRNPFPGNQIPQTSILQPARSLLALYPDPTSPAAVNNYSFPAKRTLNSAGFDVRSDYAISGTSALFARLSSGSLDGQTPGALPAPAGMGFPPGGYAGSDSSEHADALHSHETWRAGAVSYTARVLAGQINEFRAGFSINDLNAVAADSGFNAASALHIPGLTSEGMPGIDVPGYASLGAAGAAPFSVREAAYQVEDAIRWQTRRHSLKFGIQGIRRHVSGDASEWSSRGAFFFTPDYTSQPGAFRGGDAFASLLLGFPSEVRRNVQFATFRLQAWEWAGFAQDSFRLGRLAVEAGVRYSLYLPVTAADGRMVNFNYDVHAPALNQFAGQGGVNASAGVGYKKLAIAPRVGLAFDLTASGRAVLRAGFSQAYDAGSFFASGSLARNPPYTSNVDIVNGTFQLGQGLGAGLPPLASVSLLDAATLNGVRGSINAIEPANYTPYSDQWSLALETRLPRALTLEASGMGSMGMHLSSNYDANQPYPAPTPYSHPRYPYEPYHGQIEYLGFAGGSTYYGGTVRLAGRWRSGSQFQLSYTYAKSLDDATAPGTDQQSRPAVPQFAFNLRGTRSPSVYDVTQRLVWTARYDSPVKNPASKLLAALADWRIYAISTLQTGLPFTPQLSTNSLNDGGVQLPDRVGDGSLPASQRSYLHWFNTSMNPSDPSHAFETPALYQYGNSGFDILRGPGMATVDAALARSFPIGELARIQARVEAYNLLNRTNFALPERLLGLATSGVIDHTATPARRLQFALRLEW